MAIILVPGALFPYDATGYIPPKSKRNLNRTGGGGTGASAARAARRRAGKETAKDMQVTLGRENARIRALGRYNYQSGAPLKKTKGHPVGQEKRGTSIWGHISSWLSRGQYASAGAADALVNKENPFTAALAGAKGKPKSYTDVLHDLGVGEAVSNLVGGTTSIGNVAKGRGALAGSGSANTIGEGLRRQTGKAAGKIVEVGGGLVGDIGLDPTTYTGMGLVADTSRATAKPQMHYDT
jgi:hypothetical protein